MTAPKAPEGFRDVQAAEPTGPRVDKEDLRNGVILQYRGTRRFPRKQQGGVTVVHIFVSRAGKGKRFSVFGTAQLDGKLAEIAAGSIIWLLYSGKQQVDDQPTHVWLVSNAGQRLSEDKLAELRKNSKREEDTLDAAIQRAEDAQRQRGSTPEQSYERDFEDSEAVPF